MGRWDSLSHLSRDTLPLGKRAGTGQPVPIAVSQCPVSPLLDSETPCSRNGDSGP
jgi:hypothetical protein